MVVRREVSNLDSSVVVHELELAINCALYGCLGSLGSQQNVGSFSLSLHTVVCSLALVPLSS